MDLDDGKKSHESFQLVPCPTHFIHVDKPSATHENPLKEFFHLLSVQEFDCCKAIVGKQKQGENTAHGLAHQTNLRVP